MRTILTIAAGFFLIMLVAAKSPENSKAITGTTTIEFNKASWNDVLALAKKENKPIFLDISASWCGYCKKMKSTVFTDAEVSKYYNSTFINVSVDAEKGEGVMLAKRYGVKGYPTFVFLNPDGELIMQTSGYRAPGEFLKLGKTATNKLK
ncbi:MAG: thioredoxin family protein [Bacteroidales bacterium]|nr:thioredoxin family protein [Bacteroidales bacterium]